jgi:hypothetical protein
MSEETNPFQSPQMAGAAALSFRQAEFVPAQGRALLAIVFLSAVMLACLISTGSTYLQIGLLERAGAGVAIARDELVRNIVRQTLVGLFSLTMYVISGATFIVWLHRASKNLRALGNNHVEYSPGWTIGGWFIPIGNLFIPCQLMGELWNRSYPANVQSAYAVRAPGRSLVGWWWACWLVMNFVDCAANLFWLGGSQKIAALLLSSWFLLAEDLLSLPAAFLAIQLVRCIQANQQERYRLFEELKSKMSEPAADAGFPFETSLAGGGASAARAADLSFLPPPDTPDRDDLTDDEMPTPWLDK